MFSTPVQLRRRALRLLRDATSSDAVCWYALGLVDGRIVPVDWLHEGVDELFVARRAAEGIEWPHADVRLPMAQWDGRFQRLSSVVDVERTLLPSALFRRCHAPAAVHDILRLLAYDQATFAGWIGALRVGTQQTFTTKDVRSAGRIAAQVSELLIAAQRAEEVFRPGTRELVITPTAEVEWANDEAGRWLAQGEAAATLQRIVRALGPETRTTSMTLVLGGCRASCSTLTGQAGSRYLIRLDPIAALRVHPAHVLSPTQRRVAGVATAGATVVELSRMFDMSPSTIRTHLREIYARLGVGSRAELAQLLADMPQRDAELPPGESSARARGSDSESVSGSDPIALP
jgi:DNA-binding CsgD family transcriptional regulator